MYLIKQALGLHISGAVLIERAIKMVNEIGVTSAFQSIETCGNYETGLDLAETKYWCAKLERILREIAAGKPGITALYARDMAKRKPGSGCCSPGINPTIAGFELAMYLRSLDYLVLHVRPSLACALPEVGCFGTSLLVKVVAALVRSLALAMPDSLPAHGDLSQERFDQLAAGGPQSFDAGLAILVALPGVDLAGRKMCVIVIDEVDIAESEATRDKVRQFGEVVRQVCEVNKAYLVWTLSRESVVVGR